jgi:hypothetical protein
MYIRHAQNIARGEPYDATGYIYNPLNPGIGPRVYPPGLPLLLAPVVWTAGLDLWPMKALIVACFIGALLVMVALTRDIMPARYVTGLVLLVGLNPFFWEFKDHVLSDVPFLLWVLLSLLLFTRADAALPAPGWRLVLAVLAGMTAYAAYATRTLAVVLIPCFIGYSLVRYRRITASAAIASAISVVLAGVQHTVWVHDASYADQLSNPAAAAQRNVPEYLRSFSDLWENGYSDTVRKLAFVGSGALAGFGYVTTVRGGVGLLHLFPVLYLVPVILWPSFQGMRFLIPVVPFFFVFCLLGVRWLDRAAAARWGTANAMLALFLGATLAVYAARYSTLDSGPFQEGIGKRESRELFEFVNGSTDPADVFVFSRPRALALMTRRQVSGGYSPAEPCRLWEYIRQIQATYVITGPETDRFNDDAAYLRRFASRFPSDLRPVMANADVTIFRVERNPCEGG